MATTIDHIELANKNHQVLALLLAQPEETRSSEWLTTVAFYKAVHVVEAVFATANAHSKSHNDRLDRLRRPEYGQFFVHFSPLYCASMVARYLVDSGPSNLGEATSVQQFHCFTDYKPASQVISSLIMKRLNGLEQEAARRLSEENRRILMRVQNLPR